VVDRPHGAHCLVTGGAGFIGSHLVEILLAAGHRVTVVDDLSTGSRRNVNRWDDRPGVTFVEASIEEPSVLRPLVDQADQVFHLAAAVGVALIAQQPIRTIERNIYPTQILLDQLSKRAADGDPVPCFIASTSEVYGKNPKTTWCEEDDLVFGATTKPRWSYGASKAIDEFLALATHRQWGVPVVIGRFFNVVGPRQTGAYGMVLPRFVAAAIAGQPLVVHDDGQQTRCFAHVADVIDAVVQLTTLPAAAGRVFNIGSDQPISILDLARRVQARVNPQAPLMFQSYSEAYDASFEDIRRRVPDLSRLRATIDYRPRFDLDAIIDDVARDQRQTGRV
jgi:UDP-glucose 4-epimerase